MIESFKGQIAEDIWIKGESSVLPKAFWKRARQILNIMNAANSKADLEVETAPLKPRVHKLVGDRKGYFAVDIDKESGWRVTFKMKSGQFSNVCIEDYH